jgi:hypothetical protein
VHQFSEEYYLCDPIETDGISSKRNTEKKINFEKGLQREKVTITFALPK